MITGSPQAILKFVRSVAAIVCALLMLVSVAHILASLSMDFTDVVGLLLFGAILYALGVRIPRRNRS